MVYCRSSAYSFEAVSIHTGKADILVTRSKGATSVTYQLDPSIARHADKEEAQPRTRRALIDTYRVFGKD